MEASANFLTEPIVRLHHFEGRLGKIMREAEVRLLFIDIALEGVASDTAACACFSVLALGTVPVIFR